MMNPLMNRHPHLQYKELVSRWQEVTGGHLWESSGLCCKKHRAGAPECCYQLVDGERLTFTASEIRALEELHGEDLAAWRFTHHRQMGIFRFRTELISKDEHIALLKDGWMAQTLECSSHPLRPIVGAGNRVLGTVAIDGCNTKLAKLEYRQRRDEIRELWQETVDLFGVKPYYVTENIKEGWTVL